MRNLVIIGIAITSLSIAAQDASAQFSQQNRVSGFSAFSQGNSGFRSTSSQILSRSTTSPYLALVNLDGQGVGIDNSRNYFTQVRPAIDRQRQQQQQQLQIQSIQRNVTQMRSQAAQQNVTGPRGTGHPTRFQFYFQYYPGLGGRR